MNKLAFASSKERDMFYAVGMEIPDPFFFLEKNGKRYVFLDKRELGVFEKSNKNPEIKAVPLEPYIEKAKKQKSKKASLKAKIAGMILDDFEIKDKVYVPDYFSVEVYEYLKSLDFKLKVLGDFFPERRKKNSDEIKLLENALKKTQSAFKRIEKILEEAEIKSGKIYYNNETLTSELLKKEAEKELLEKDLIDLEGMIISSGKQGSRPHDRGSGEIKPHTPIIVDIFPKDRESGYFADMTRTYLKGEAPNKIIQMYNAVKEVQENAIRNIKAGVKAFDVYKECFNIFEKYGFKTEEEGFVTGLGHGLGVDVHEQPFVNSFSDAILSEGDVITVEPGLYYSELGGSRIEDVVVVTKDGCKNLTNYPKNLLIE